MAMRRWWEPPQLRTDEDQHRERRVGWLELFFDLIFVVLVAEVAHYLSSHLSVAGVLGYILLFMATWWAWIGGTFYNERFEASDISYRLLTFLHLIPIAAMAVFAYHGLDSTSSQFALSYAATRVLLVFMWLRGGWHTPAFRPVSNRYALGFSASICLFVISVFVPAPLRFALWAAGLLIDIVTPLATIHLQRTLPRYSSSRMPERFGLFVIIVLGEAIVGVIRGVAELTEEGPLSLATSLAGILGLALAFSLWWVYFDFIARRPPRVGWTQVGWMYWHLPLLMSIAAIGVGVLNVLTIEEQADYASSYWLLSGALATALVAMGLIERTLRRAPDEPTNHQLSTALKLGGGALALLIGAAGQSLGPVAFMAALLLPVLPQIVYGAYVWFHQVPTAPAEDAMIAEGGA